jgi:hypothetical protein
MPTYGVADSLRQPNPCPAPPRVRATTSQLTMRAYLQTCPRTPAALCTFTTGSDGVRARARCCGPIRWSYGT